MKLCAVQCRAHPGRIEHNLIEHLRLIDMAIEHRADLIFFPELSLTGYEPKLADALAATIDDPRLDVLQARADDANIIIGAGLPIRAPQGVHIAMVWFQPHTQRQVYAKQQLHRDEFPFFVAGDEHKVLVVGGHTLAPAICYESLQPNHAEAAASLGADIYLASVAKPARNVVTAYEHYPRIAQQHSMSVLMANAIGASDDFISAGQSAIWNPEGKLIASMGEQDEGFLLFDTESREGNRIFPS